MLDNSSVLLTENEKTQMCKDLAKHLPEIRKLLHLSQAALGERCGVSRNRIILIESEKFVMTWSQYTSFLFLFMLNQQSKEYLFLSGLFSLKMLQFMQQKGRLNPPDINVKIDKTIVEKYDKAVKQHIDDKMQKL